MSGWQMFQHRRAVNSRLRRAQPMSGAPFAFVPCTAAGICSDRNFVSAAQPSGTYGPPSRARVHDHTPPEVLARRKAHERSPVLKPISVLTVILCLTFAGSTFWVPDFGGFEPDQFPVPQEDPAIQPAGYAFAIWGLIYGWLLAGMTFGLWKRAEDSDWHAMRGPLCVSLAVGSIWLPVADKSPVWAAILIWAMLIPALIALFRAPRGDTAWALAPVALYAGWLSAASCVALGLIAAGYGYLDEQTAALVFIFAALVIASAVQNQLRRAPAYGIAVIWALVAIVVQNASTNPTVAALAAGGAIALVLPVWRVWRGQGCAT
jgi:hypothetical protein